MLGLRLPTVPGEQSAIDGGLGLELEEVFGALGAAGGPGQRERALAGALRLRGREPLAVPVGGELGELVHGGRLLPGGGGFGRCAPLSPDGAGGHHT